MWPATVEQVGILNLGPAPSQLAESGEWDPSARPPPVFGGKVKAHAGTAGGALEGDREAPSAIRIPGLPLFS